VVVVVGGKSGIQNQKRLTTGSYQSQTGAKPNRQSNLLLSVGKQLQDEPVLTEVYVELWIDTI